MINLKKKEDKKPYFTTLGKFLVSSFFGCLGFSYCLASIWILFELKDRIRNFVIFNFWFFLAFCVVTGIIYLILVVDFTDKVLCETEEEDNYRY